VDAPEKQPGGGELATESVSDSVSDHTRTSQPRRHPGVARQHANDEFRPLERIQERGAFRLLQLLARGSIANVESQILRIDLPDRGGTRRIDLGQHITKIGTSPDERRVVAMIAGEAVVIDLEAMRIASFDIATDGVGYAGFPANDVLAISASNGLYRIDPTKLDYRPL
jgi:hypothetical protein